MKTVYIVMTGEPYEGGSIVGVFSDKQKAEAYMIHAKETQDPEEVSYFWWRIKEHEVDPAQ